MFRFFRRITGRLSLATLLAGGIINAQAETIIAAVGDSITAGYPDQSCARGQQNYGGYVPYLKNLLDGDRWPSTIYNYGIAGDMAQWAYKPATVYCTNTTWVYDVNWEYSNDQITHNQIPVALARSPKPEYILYLFGTNDLAWMHAKDAVEYMKTGIRMIYYDDVLPVVGTLLPDTRAEYDYKDITGANALLRAWLDGSEVPIAELYYATSVAGWASMMPDGIHPNAAGRELMASVWFDTLDIELTKDWQEKYGPIAASAAINTLLLLDE